jgi:RimJ/RimL family protein N-acetyltransferase
VKYLKKIKYPLNSKRLILTPYKIDFCEEYFLLKQLQETHRYNYTPVLSKQEASGYVKKLSEYDYYNPKGRLELVIILKDTQNFIGFIGFKDDEYTPSSSAEIFFTLHPDYFNKGLGTEAVRTMIDFGFNTLGLHRIWAGSTCENIGSWKIMEKIGMRRESHWIADRPKPGKWIPNKGFEKSNLWEDGYGYAILMDEFNEY